MSGFDANCARLVTVVALFLVDTRSFVGVDDVVDVVIDVMLIRCTLLCNGCLFTVQSNASVQIITRLR